MQYIPILALLLLVNPAQAQQLNNQQITQLVSGKKFSVIRKDGAVLQFYYSRNNNLRWEKGHQSGNGRWWVRRNKLCDRYHATASWGGRGPKCQRIKQVGDYYMLEGGSKLFKK